jgi:hypothetical protein
MQKFKVYKAYTNTFDREFDTWEEVLAFIERKAAKLNFGMFRSWEDNNSTYFDVGPTTYLVRPNLQ